MDSEQWFSVARDIVMLVITGLVFYWGRDRKQTADAIGRRFEDLEKLTERGNEKTSELASRVQFLVGRIDRLPEDMREKFLAKDTADLLIAEWRRDRDRLESIYKAMDRRKDVRD